MLKARSVSWLAVAAFQMTPSVAPGQTETPHPVRGSSTPVIESKAGSPLVVGVAIDEVGITAEDLEASRSTVLAVFDALPGGSLMAVASFKAEQRIVLPPTSARALVKAALADLKPGAAGVALPDGLFDVVDYLGRLEASARGVLLVSAGNMRAGDLQFEDLLNAATTRNIPIVTLGLGQGDGQRLRRIARVTHGEFVRLEVADPSMLAHALFPRAAPEAPAATLPEPAPASSPTETSSSGLLGAAAILLALAGLLILGAIAILLIRRSARSSRPPESLSKKPRPSASRGSTRLAPIPDTSGTDDQSLERTLVVNTHPTLRALCGGIAGKEFRLPASGETTIGRSRQNHIVVAQDAASAQHCRIHREGDSYVLYDLGATNGTWVNGAKIDRAVLQHGDRLRVGDTVFMVSLFGDRT